MAIIQLLLSLALAQSGTVGVDRFGGLEDSNLPAVISPYRAQDALNVESSLDGRSLRKRKGYSLEATLTVSTDEVTGLTSFVDSSGNNVRVACNNVYCAKSVNGGAFSNFLTTATSSNTRWSFVNINGKLYGANSSRDIVFQYDGTTLSYPPEIPRGSILELTRDRLVVADTSANPNRVTYSKSGDYTEFTTGTGSADPWTDDFGTPGDKVTGLKYSQGKMYVFKQQSITACILGDQYTTDCFPISNSIGTIDPASIVEAPDGIYFRSQDRTYWKIDRGDSLGSISLQISSTTKSQTSGSQQNNTQTTQADWEAGSQNPSSSFNTTTRSGSIFNSSITLVDTSGSDFGSFTSSSSISTGIVPGSVVLSYSTFNFRNGDLSSGDFTNWTQSGSWTKVDGSGNSFNLCGISISSFARSGCSTNASKTSTIRVESSEGTLLDSCSVTWSCTGSDCVRSSDTCDQSVSITNGWKVSIDISTHSASTVRVVITDGDNNASITSISSHTAKTVSVGMLGQVGVGCPVSNTAIMYATCGTENYLASGNLTSRTFDTTYSTPTGGTFSVDMSSASDYDLTFQIQESTDSDDTFGSLSSITPGDRITLTKRYWRYKASFSQTTSTRTAILNSVDLIASTTGQFRTQCIQPGSDISSWGILSCAESNIGNGSNTFYSTSAATCATLPATDPSNWTATTNNATLTITTAAAMYVGWKSLLGSATDQAQVDACTVYWNVGSVAQPVFGTYDTINNAIYWTTGVNNSATSNRVLKYDLNLGEWFPWGLSFGPLLMYQNSLYAGDSTAGKIHKYGGSGVDSDAGSSINAYWKSRDFPGVDPFRETSWQRIHLLAKNQITGNLTLDFATSLNQTGSYTVSLATSSAIGYSRTTYAIPLKSPSNFLNVKFGNNSSTPFEILGFKLDYFTNPWSPMNP